MTQLLVRCYNNHNTILEVGKYYIIATTQAPNVWACNVPFTEDELFTLTFDEEDLGDYFVERYTVYGDITPYAQELWTLEYIAESSCDYGVTLMNCSGVPITVDVCPICDEYYAVTKEVGTFGVCIACEEIVYSVYDDIDNPCTGLCDSCSAKCAVDYTPVEDPEDEYLPF